MIKLYGSSFSQPTRAVMWTLLNLEVDYTFHKVDASKGEHTTPEFLKRNPNAKFPVLDDNGVVLWESHAIMRYLAAKHKDVEPTLYPSDLKARALVDSWLDWKHSHLRPGAAGVVRRRVMQHIMKDISHHSMRYDLKEIPESREARILMESLNVMDKQLQQTRYITGDFPTIADIALSTEIEQLMMLPAGEGPPFGRDIATGFSSIANWQESMRSVKGFEKSHGELQQACKQLDKMRKKSKL